MAPLSRLSDLVSIAAPALPVMPLFHTTDGFSFRAMCEDGRCKPQLCPVYNQDLTYLYYGIPGYSPNSINIPNSLSSLKLVTLIFNFNRLVQPVRIMPFDSGAMSNDIFKRYLNPRSRLNDFLLRTSVLDIQRFVRFFYQSNENYYKDIVIESLDIPSGSFEAESYYHWCLDRGSAPYDIRRSCIEVQINMDLLIDENVLMACIVPEDLADMDSYINIVSNTTIETLTYTSYRAQPLEDRRAIYDVAHIYLQRKGVLQ